ncbi:MAG: U32 family peptidase [Rikenellaceae bacterium]
MKPTKKRAIELLAPAKNLAAAIAAIDHGADAIYIGGESFGARQGACNSYKDIATAAEYAHQYGAKIYGALNTLIFEDELKAARDAAMGFIEAGVDALIIQDFALLRMNLPIELHASTQMCNNSLERVKFLEECGIKRVVLERALSLAQIQEIGSKCNVELEAFVHGAICVSHSGRCLLSRASSTRSGNRGACSQPCRLSYDLVSETGKRILSSKHLLSVLDMNLSDRLEDLIDAGVSSLKIEGRLKDIDYTKNIVSHYNQKLNEIITRRNDLCRSSLGEVKIEFEPDPAKSFSRGASTFLLDGSRRGLASFDSPKSIGELLGRVKKVGKSGFILEQNSPLAPQDGIAFFTNKGELRGTNINSIEGEWIYPNRVDGIAVGGEIYRNYDRLFHTKLERSNTRRTIKINASIELIEGGIKVGYSDGEHHAEAEFKGEFGQAEKREKMAATAEREVRKCGNTIYEVNDVKISLFDQFIPSSIISQLRREALSQLHKTRLENHKKGGINFKERADAPLYKQEITADENITNSLSKSFLMDHGAKHIAPAMELKDNLVGEKVMESSYCIRREIGECLREGSQLKEPLYIERGTSHFRLIFDCACCRMDLIKI